VTRVSIARTVKQDSQSPPLDLEL